MTNFDEDYEKGKEGEIIFKTFYKNFEFNKSTNEGWIDTTKSPNYQNIDVDFVWYRNGGSAGIEIKYDTRICSTGNIFAEDIIEFNDKSRGTINGFMHKSQADILNYIDAKNRIMYTLNFAEFKKYVFENEKSFRRGVCYSSMNDARDSYKSFGWLVPMREIRNVDGIFRMAINY